MFKLLKKLILWPPVLFTLIYLGLLLLTWLMLPVLMSAAPREEREVVQLGVTVAFGLLWGVALLVSLYRALRRNGLRLPSLPRRAQPVSGGLLDDLRADRAVALDALAHIPEARTWPRLVIIGPTGSGKSASLTRCGQAPTRLDGRSTPYQQRAGEHCAWVRCGPAVYLDTPGRLVDDDGAREVWRALLTTLRESPRDPPVDAIIVVVNLRELVGARHGAEARILADRLRGRLDDAVEILGQAPAFHLVVSHCDALAGYADYLRDLDAQPASRPLGRSVEPETQISAEQAGEARKTLDDLILRLERRVVHAVSTCDQPRMLHTLLFPAQLAAIRAPVEALVGQLTRRQGAAERAPLAGLWFTGVAATGAELDQLSHILDARFRLSPPLESTPGSAGAHGAAGAYGRAAEGRPLFLAGLFLEVFPRTSSDGALTKREQQALQRRAERQLRSLILAVVVLALSVGIFGVLNLRYLRGLERRWAAVLRILPAERPMTAPQPALSAELALLGAWGAPGWRLPGGLVARQSLALAGEDAVEPPAWLARAWLWPARLRASDAVEGIVLDLVQERLMREVSRLAREDLLRLAATLPPDEKFADSSEMEGWLVDAQASLELARRWRALYQPASDEAGGQIPCADQVFTQEEQEVARWLARRIGLARSVASTTSLETTIADEEEASELDAWLIGRLFERGGDRCASLATLVPTPEETAPIEAALRGLDPSEAVFALLFSRVGAKAEATAAKSFERPRLQITSKILQVDKALKPAPSTYDLLSCQEFQIQLYLMDHEGIGTRLLDQGKKAKEGGFGSLRDMFGGQGFTTAESLVTWGEVERLAGALPTPERRKQLLLDLRKRYESNYSRQWRDRWLKSLVVADRRTSALQSLGLRDLADELRALYGPQGSLNQALALLGRGQPGYLVTKEGSDVATKGAHERCNALAATWRGAHGLVDSAEQSSAFAAFADQAQKMLDLASTLESVASDADKRSKLVLDTYSENSSLYSAWLATLDVERLGEVPAPTSYGTTDPPPAVLSENDARRLVFDGLVSPVSRSALYLIWGQLLGDFEQDVESDWRAEVVSLWNQVARGYPLNRNASALLDASATGELFGEGGAVDSFLEAQLAPWVSPGEIRLRSPEPLGPQAPALVPTSELSLLVTKRRERWRAIESLSKPLEFRLTPSDDTSKTSRTISSSLVTVNGQTVLMWRWETPKTVTVKGTYTDQVRLQVNRGDQRESVCADTQGEGRDAGQAPLTMLKVIGAPARQINPNQPRYYVSLSPQNSPHSNTRLPDACQATWIIEDDGSGPVSLYHALTSLELDTDLLSYQP